MYYIGNVLRHFCENSLDYFVQKDQVLKKRQYILRI